MCTFIFKETLRICMNFTYVLFSLIKLLGKDLKFVAANSRPTHQILYVKFVNYLNFRMFQFKDTFCSPCILMINLHVLIVINWIIISSVVLPAWACKDTYSSCNLASIQSRLPRDCLGFAFLRSWNCLEKKCH